MKLDEKERESSDTQHSTKGKGVNVNLKSALYIKKSHYLFTCI